jgi:flagellar biosynthetic protein FliQ
MTQDLILKLAKDTLQITLMVSGPLLLVSLLVGIIVSIAQVVTSIQDMTLSLVPRMLAVFVVFLLLLPWVMQLMISYSVQLFGHLEAWQWTPNLIWFDNLRSFGTPSYYVQQLFSANRGTRLLPDSRMKDYKFPDLFVVVMVKRLGLHASA